jgi:CheY-like chemotaxis protein
MDCQMPVMDGYAATHAIRADPRFAKLPVLAMTANAMAGDREKAIASGMQDHIPKPLDVRTMFATMAKWIRPRRAAAAPAPSPAPAAKAAPRTDDPGLPVLPGIDVAAGLATAVHDTSLYRRLLRKFRDGQRGFAEQFQAALGGADATAPARAAHTLKGVAANLGARGVQAAAGELEKAALASAPAERLQALLARVVEELRPVVAGLEALDDAAAPRRAASPGAPDPALVRAQVARLEKLLGASDTESADAAEELARLVSGSGMEGAVDGIAAAIADYDFDAALAALRRLQA